MTFVGLCRNCAGCTRGVIGHSKSLSYRTQILQIMTKDNAHLGSDLLIIETKYGINTQSIRKILGILS
jgi:hypothetical protein